MQFGIRDEQTCLRFLVKLLLELHVELVVEELVALKLALAAVLESLDTAKLCIFLPWESHCCDHWLEVFGLSSRWVHRQGVELVLVFEVALAVFLKLEILFAVLFELLTLRSELFVLVFARRDEQFASYVLVEVLLNHGMFLLLLIVL